MLHIFRKAYFVVIVFYVFAQKEHHIETCWNKSGWKWHECRIMKKLYWTFVSSLYNNHCFLNIHCYVTNVNKVETFVDILYGCLQPHVGFTLDEGSILYGPKWCYCVYFIIFYGDIKQGFHFYLPVVSSQCFFYYLLHMYKIISHSDNF